MRILYDGRIFQLQKAGGINRYFAEIIAGLPGDFQPVVTGVDDFGQNAPSHPNLERRRLRGIQRYRVMRQFHDKWWKPRLLGGVDLFHPTYYDFVAGFSLADFKCPMVLTVHDFIFAMYPKLIEGSEAVIQTSSCRDSEGGLRHLCFQGNGT